MATPVPTQPRVSKTAVRAIVRAYERAKAEKIVVYRVNPLLLGVASVADGWKFRPYSITITGNGIKDVRCNCAAGLNGRLCKHAVAAMFARKHGVYACKPIPTSDPLAGLIA